jgi:hypothetical protein
MLAKEMVCNAVFFLCSFSAANAPGDQHLFLIHFLLIRIVCAHKRNFKKLLLKERPQVDIVFVIKC